MRKISQPAILDVYFRIHISHPEMRVDVVMIKYLFKVCFVFFSFVLY